MEHSSQYIRYIIGIVQVVINVITVVLIFEQCSPTARLRDISIPGTCDGIIRCSQVGYIQSEIEDKTSVITKLAIWVVTEMWFIIIFGSIPTLRMLFVRFSQDIKSAVGHDRSRSGGRMQLRDRRTQGSGPGSGTEDMNGSRYALSGEGFDPRRWERELGDGRLLVTRGITVISEERQGSIHVVA
ncbi:hypothetical protein N7478_002334 [Penicillium angulare]|uniref:uncharacterized protein n=1 Tax=Penicillium angulare TaxID=116970 RepID=UPI00253FE776|nr:uncharacterized protein N7478_002334 [Penicillium angulare]KAJ5286648.1 hypothetical protein N7478_002334 [Penicillium angulare]